ncbi:MAG: hypothetical protein K8S99_15950 [Planctomycetes bacterium]|nr:hypothetical protein [Planctomycetota bacterium]
MKNDKKRPPIYEGDGDRLMADLQGADRIILLPDARPSKTPDRSPKMRIMWGQLLLEDLLAGRYRTLVCAVNGDDNRRGIITQLATLLPTSQWDEKSITSHAKAVAGSSGKVHVLKYDLDAVEVLGVGRPAGSDHLTMADLSEAFKIVAQMLERRPDRLPTASVSFLGARSNALRDENGREPSFEAVLHTMYEAGFCGDVYPAPSMWESNTPVYARYPFPPALEAMRQGGF